MNTRVQHIRGTTAEVEASTVLPGELGYDTSRKEGTIGDGSTLGGSRIAKKDFAEGLVCAQIVANTNNYNPTDQKYARRLIIDTDASRDITGLVPVGTIDTTNGLEKEIYNAGSFNAVLKDQSGSSTAANRFDFGGADVTLGPKQGVILRYRGGSLNRWELMASTAGVTAADASISARKLAASALAAGTIVNGSLVHSRAGSAETIALKTLAGTDPSATDPVHVVFRDPTAANGNNVVRSITAALSLTLSSGSSMGFTNSVAGRLWWTLIDTGAGVVLGAINCLSGMSIYPLAGWGIVTTTAEGGAGAADSAHVMYSAAAQTSKPYVIAGYSTWESGLAAAGTWNTAPSRVQLFGPGVSLPGQQIQKQRLQTGASTTGTTLIPQDDTIPQNSEGNEYLSQAITPTSAANLLQISAQLSLANSAVNGMISALFQDSVANALAVSSPTYVASAGASVANTIDHAMLAGTVSATTFKVRSGGVLAGTTTFNGAAGSRLFGGVSNSFLDVREIMT